jgi:Family of unknown function (DUF6941)
MAKSVLPRVQAMVLCDSVQESNEEVGVFHLDGVRSILDAQSFPAFRPRLCIFLQMSGHAGQASCHIEIDRSELSEVIYQSAPKSITFESPALVEPVFFRLRNCVFPAPGLYYVQLFDGGKIIGERPLLVRET